jgi:hypothetical protein
MSVSDLRPPGDDWRDLLSALLDGELPPDEEARVQDLVAGSPEAQEELAALAQVRTLVRELPPVDPPFGFFERLGRPERHPRHVGAKLGGALAAAAAAIVLVVGITPATDPIVPPVAAYAERHLEMEPVAATRPAPPATSAPTTTSTAAPPPTVTTDDFAPVADAELDAMGTPATLMGEFRRMSGYQSGDGAMHLVYSDGTLMVSVYEQPGVLAWDRLPSGTMVQVDGQQAWTMVGDAEEVMVFERGPVVYTVVAQITNEAHDDMVAMAVELPDGTDPSVFDRFRDGCRSVVARFSMGTAEP